MKMPMTSIASGTGFAVMPDVYYFTVQIVNVVFIGDPSKSNEFVLVDAGMPDSHDMIINAAIERFGEDCRLKGIVLTHGHFDHVGAIEGILRKWNAPVYAHQLEEPFLNGESEYPEANPQADDGLVAKMAPMFPRHGIDISAHLQRLPSNGEIPILPGWNFIHTPGHTPGHISLFREADKLLIAGDAITTTEQESLYKVLTQKQELHGPPQYFTPDWQSAWDSVKIVSNLKPEIAITGHGLPMTGPELISGLEELAANFKEQEIPDNTK